MAELGVGPLAEGFLRMCLWAWPARDRRTHGEALLEATRTALRERPPGPRRWLATAAEAGAIVAGGLRRRSEAARGALGMGWWGDVRFAWRTHLRSPGLTLVAVATLALGIGATTSIFSLVDAVVLRSPPYDRPEELVLVWNALPGSNERVAVAAPDAAVVEDRAESLAEVAFTIRGVDGSLEAAPGAGAVHARLATVTHDFFQLLGVGAALGRVFDESEAPGARSLDAGLGVVLADRIWRSAFGADPAVLGSEVRVNGIPVTVVGVMGPEFELALPPDAGIVTDVDVWIPTTVPLTDFHRAERLLDRDSDNTGVVIGRLAPGATLPQAQAELDRIAADLRAEVPQYATEGLGFDLRPLQADATAHARPLLLALMLGAGIMLLVGCLNTATLLLARGVGRSRELAVRASLGAVRGRIVRQLLVEGAVLVGVGLVAALGVAYGTGRALASLAPPELGVSGAPPMGLRVLGFAIVSSVLSAVVAGLLPALRVSRMEERGSLGHDIVRGGPGRGRLRRSVVAAQVALSVVLTLSAGLLVRTVASLQAVRPGFDAEGALTFRISLRVPERYRGPADRAALMQELGARVSELPGVRAVGLVGVLPLGGDRWTQPYGLHGEPESEWHRNRADFQMVSSGYFDAIGARVLEGRVFTQREDIAEDDRVAVIDEKLAERIAGPGGSALDATIGVPVDGAPVEARVVGVVEHIRHERLDADGRETIYVPYRQEASRDVSFVVRTAGSPAGLAPAVRRVVRELDPQIPVYGLRTLQDYLDRAVAPRRFAVTLLISFAAFALLCTAIGLYGIVAFDVRSRTRDIGLRMALGASGTRVVRTVLGWGLRLGLIGIGAGAALALVVARGIRGLLYGVEPIDVATWGAVVVLVGAVTLLATWVPARRAGRLAPREALRTE